MARTQANGAQLSIGELGASITMSAITNAAEAVATLSAAHGVVVGNYLLISSGWGALDGRVARVKTVATNDVTLELIDTTSVSIYPAGSGVGSVKKITWASLSQILEFGSQGGEQQYGSYQYVDQDRETKFPTLRSGVTLEMTIHDDIALTQYTKMKAAVATGAPAPVLFTARSGYKIAAAGYWSLGSFPVIQKNDFLQRAVSIAVTADATEYAS